MSHFSGFPARTCAALVLLCVPALQAQVPGAPTLSSPTNGATVEPTSITVAWNVVSGASSYTLQLSQTSTFSTLVVNQGGILAASEPISGLAINTFYYWRVSASGSVGTGSWSSIWSFATGIPTAPTLVSPGNGAMNQSAAVTLSWVASVGATTYGFQVSTASTFTSVFLNHTGIAVTSASAAELSYAATFYWRVNATNSAGTSAWSSIWSFTTGQQTAVPTLVSPANGALNQPLSLTLSWNSVTTASTYAFQVSTVPSFSTTISYQAGITPTKAAISGLSNNTTYYWRVYAAGPYGTSAWSGAYDFTTVSVTPAPPLLTSPSNNAIDISYRPVFTWQGANTTTYTLQISSASNFPLTIVNHGGLISRDSTGLTLAFNATYFWRVNATNSAGTSAWSSVWSFTVSAPIPAAAPALVSPASGANAALPVLLSWGIVAGATSYTLNFFYYGEQNSPWYDTVVSTTNCKESSILNPYVGYYVYWYVYANNGSGSGPGSSAWMFWPVGTSTLPRAAASPLPSFSIKNSSLLYTLTTPSQVEVSLYTMRGRKIMLLNRRELSGSYTLSLKNRNLPAGAYFLHFKANMIDKRMKIVVPGG